jgi:hypothetical protein
MAITAVRLINKLFTEKTTFQRLHATERPQLDLQAGGKKATFQRPLAI